MGAAIKRETYMQNWYTRDKAFTLKSREDGEVSESRKRWWSGGVSGPPFFGGGDERNCRVVAVDRRPDISRESIMHMCPPASTMAKPVVGAVKCV